MQIPLIDLGGVSSDSLQGSQKVVGDIRHACTTVGFFVVKGHGIDTQIIENAFDSLTEFFALPDQVKGSCYSTEKPVAHQHNGYKALRAENAYAAMGRLGMLGDKLEKYSMTRWLLDDFRNLPFPDSEFGCTLRKNMKAYYQACLKLSDLLIKLFAIACDLPVDFFTQKTDRSWDYLRFHYFPGADEQGQFEEGLAPHTDGSLLTILADVSKGLQVKTRAGEWIKVEGRPVDHLIVNIGDPYARWTNDHWVSTPHRVVLGCEERKSIAFFKVANEDAVIDALPKFCRQGAKKYPPVVYADWITERRAAMGEKSQL